MDHISLPSDDLAHIRIEVPRLFGDGFAYDDQGMLTYPSRAGIDTKRLATDNEPRLPILHAGAFIQAWLWCGLLQEGYRVGFRPTTAPKHASSDLFVKNADERHFVSMTELSVIASWACNSARSPVAEDWHRERVLSCIETASDFVSEILGNKASGAQLLVRDSKGHLSDTTAVLLSVQVLCQTLQNDLDVPVYGDSRSSTPHPPLRQSFWIVDSLLQQSGWHPTEILQLPQDIIFRYYVSFYRRKTALLYPTRTSASDGSSDNGQSHLVDEAQSQAAFVPIHTFPDCRCEYISADSEEIENNLTSGKLILARFVRERCSIVIKSFHKDFNAARSQTQPHASSAAEIPPFLAISHVRSAGLGNDASHSLPFCQLARLQELANESCGSVGGDGAFFWIDSLCLPLCRQKRHFAVHDIWQVFQTANAVMVIDPPLSKHVVSTSEEALLRIRYSGWKSRLWTLEEGFATPRLLFLFQNRIYSIDKMLRDLERTQAARGPGMVPVLQPCRALLSQKDEQRLSGILAKLRYDLRLLMEFDSSLMPQTHAAAEASSHHEQHVSKEGMQRLLRLAYLIAGKFRYLLETDERRWAANIWHGINELYKVEQLDVASASPSMEQKVGAARMRIIQLYSLARLEK